MRKGQPVSNHHSQKSKGEVRIITGQWRGRKLPVLNSQGLRPTTDRIKETLFNWLMPYIAGARCLDCFAGSGSLEEVSGDPFFSVSYAPQGGLQHLIWRSVAIPLVTAADAIRVLQEQFSGQPLWGATSSFVASLFGMERIEFERLVFAAQWGQNETGTGSSNSVYITEAFINFGWSGVVIFSFLIGLMMRMFAVSRDEAFRALWPLFAFGVYTYQLLVESYREWSGGAEFCHLFPLPLTDWLFYGMKVELAQCFKSGHCVGRFECSVGIYAEFYLILVEMVADKLKQL